MNMEEQLRAVVAQAETDGQKWHIIVHGNDETTVPTENGNVPTVAKQLKDVRDAITGGVSDVVAEAEAARDMAVAAKNETVTLKNATNQIKTETQLIKESTQAVKASADAVFNNISTTTNSSIQTIQTETASQVSLVKSTGSAQVSSVQSAGTTQVSNVNAAGATQIALATAQANQAKYYAEACAPTPLGSRLTVPANTKVPDGYEPVWYKNTITRARYPDFFAQLVDTNSLTLVSESTYDSQVSTYGMCASYVKVDNDTLILPLLVNFARGGTTSQLGGVHLDQFQGHYHSSQIRQDSYGSGDGAALYPTGGTDEGLRADGPDLVVLNPKTGAHGTARFGTETRPKAYYELNYIKCADISRPLTSEETSEIRTALASKINTNLSNFPSNIDYCTTNYMDANGNWYRIYKSGRLEQGGFFGGATSSWANVSITYLKPFKDTKYQLFCLGNWSDAASSSCRVYAKSTTGASITYANNTNGIQLSVWYAVGRI